MALKIDLRKLAGVAVKLLAPIAAAAVAQKVTTGKVDLRGLARDAAGRLIADRIRP